MVPLPGNRTKVVQTRGSETRGLAYQLDAIEAIMKILESVKEDVADLAHMLGYERTGVKTQDQPEDTKGEFSNGIEVRNRDENEIPTKLAMEIPYVPCSYSRAEEEERNTDEEGPRMIDEQPLDEAAKINSLAVLENFNRATMTIRGTTPFSVAYDWELPALLPGTLGGTKNAELEQQWVKWDVLKLLWSSLVKA